MCRFENTENWTFCLMYSKIKLYYSRKEAKSWKHLTHGGQLFLNRNQNKLFGQNRFTADT